MKAFSYQYLGGVAVIGLGLAVSGCQQTPPTQTVVTPAQPSSQAQHSPTPQPSTESTTTTKSTEVKPADPDNPDPGVKTTTTESTTVKKKP